jgi:hypothetical protein
MEKMQIYQHSLDSIFSKKDLYNFSYNPLNKTQIIVKITCKKAEEFTDIEYLTDDDYIPGYCLFDLNTYNENYTSEYEIIEKNETKSYIIFYDYTVSFIDINIEVIYGDISINFINGEPDEQRVYKNKYIYEFPGSDIELEIKGKKEKSYYHIIYFPLIMETKFNFINLYNIGGNYLILFNEKNSLFTFENKLDENFLDPLSNNTTNDTIFIGFYPVKGDFSPKSLESANMTKMKMDNLAFYQDIRVLDKNYRNFSYIVSKNN